MSPEDAKNFKDQFTKLSLSNSSKQGLPQFEKLILTLWHKSGLNGKSTWPFLSAQSQHLGKFPSLSSMGSPAYVLVF